MVHDTKILLNVLVLYIPLPVFWSLFDQQGSRWTFQATRMDGDLGGFEIKPDQMQVVNPLLILVFIPVYDIVFYPLLSKIGVRRPLQKLTLGGILAGVAFLCSAVVELQLEETYPVLPMAGESQFRVYNTLPCDYNVATNIPDHGNFIIKSMESYQQRIAIESTQSYTYTMTSDTVEMNCPTLSGSFALSSGQANGFYVRQGSVVSFIDSPEKSRTGSPIARILANTLGNQLIRIIDANHSDRLMRYNGTASNTTRIELLASSFEVFVEDRMVGAIDLRQGSVTQFLISQTAADAFLFREVVLTPANSMHMLWLLPQYIIMTLGEVMFSITGLAFSYSQAPVSMKSVLQACWLLAVAFGNVIDIIVVGARAFESQVSIAIKLSS